MLKNNDRTASSLRPGRKLLRRAMVLAAVCTAGSFAVLTARLYKLQISDHGFYESLAIEQQLREADTSSARGTIFDRNMQALAVSASVDNVFLSPAEIAMYGEDRELIASGLSELLGLDYDDILEKTGQTSKWYVTAARKVEKEQADAVRRFKEENNLRGVRLETDTKRYYPNSSLACHLIGFVGTDNYGLEGIEAGYNTALTGSTGRTVRLTNAYGTDLLFSRFEEYLPGEDGYDLVTTIDSTIQYYIEKHLKQAVEDYDIQNGAGAIAMDPNTGEVLAMVSLDGYDLNDFLSVSDEAQAQIDLAPTQEEKNALLREAQTRQWRNKVLSDTYEPGSTFKIITLSMALEEGAVDMDDTFFCGGSVNVQGRTSPIRCWKSGGHGSQSLTQAVQHSCNAAFVKIGQRVGAEKFYDYCEAFGFLDQTDDPDETLTATTGIDLAGESGSIWWSRNVFCNEKNLSQLAAASFGQTFTITPVQLITAVSACINGGHLMQPYVVEKMLNNDGSLAYEREPHELRQVISAETSQKVRSILEQVVGDMQDGTGHNAAVAGYRIGGKTGTSEKVSLEASTGTKEYIVSFIGFAPADAPQIVILIFLDTPSNESGIYISGGQMAAPVVGKMMADILPYLGVRPDYSGDDTVADVTVPDAREMSAADARKLMSDNSLRCRTIGDGDTVTAQLPAPGTVIASGTELILYLEAVPSQETEMLPDVIGMTYEQARDTLSYYGIYIQTSSPVDRAGNQVISTQNTEAGTPVGHGSVISVTLVSSDESLLGRY